MFNKIEDFKLSVYDVWNNLHQIDELTKIIVKTTMNN
jgi:hypothetical protein